jgi:hypothetical protein
MENVLTFILSFKVGGDAHLMRVTTFKILTNYQSVLKSLQILSLGYSLSSVINPL